MKAIITQTIQIMPRFKFHCQPIPLPHPYWHRLQPLLDDQTHRHQSFAGVVNCQLLSQSLPSR